MSSERDAAPGLDLDGVQRIGDLLPTHPLRRSVEPPPLLPPVADDLRRGHDTSRESVSPHLPAVVEPSACPRCAGEHTRVYRPGAPEHRPHITSPEDAADILAPLLGHLDREHCLTLNLDAKHRLIAATTVSIGSIDHTFMSPREIFRDALLHGAGAIVVAHNHPSGDPEPSNDDEAVTRRLERAGDIVGIDVVDHIVVGGDRWVSLSRRGLLIGAHLDEADRIIQRTGARGR